jgi:hypothetical protein|tara:strand:+ start:17 stop:403 length:387 start_codon:yes stop_codon:yes gene_type:complete
MKNRVINIPTNNEIIHRQVLEFLLVGSDFSPQEKDVIAEYIKLNDDFSALPIERRLKFIFSSDIRKEVAEKLGMTDANQVSTVISKIKKKDYLGSAIFDEDNKIMDALLFKPGNNEGFQVTINFNHNV